MKKIATTKSQTTQTELEKFVSSQTNHSIRPLHRDVTISARNEMQKEFLRSLNRNRITIATGPAGCGKTYIPTVRAIQDLVNGIVNRIVIVRPSVDVEGENEVGALPGDIIGKYGPQIKPVTDTMVEYFGSSKTAALIEAEVIEIVPVAFLRGRSFKNAWILVDEAQNLTKTAMKAVLTRIGQDCRMCVSGDVDQTDREENNGLEDLIGRLKRYDVKGIGFIEFSVSEVEREPIIRDVLRIYEDRSLSKIVRLPQAA